VFFAVQVFIACCAAQGAPRPTTSILSFHQVFEQQLSL